MKHDVAAEQVTEEELAIIHTIREVMRRGYGEVTVKVHDGEVRDVVKMEKIKVAVDAA